jgi:hypothetical protein
MPHWVGWLAVAVVGWLMLTIGGGMLVGRFIGAVSRHRRRSA